MEELIYTKNQYARLRQYLQTLFTEHDINSSLIIEAIREKKGKLAAVPERTDLDKIRRGDAKTPTGPEIKNLWEILHTTYAGPLGLKPNGTATVGPGPEPAALANDNGHALFEALSQFYNVNQHRRTRLVRFLTGRFVFYHFSELLWDHASPARRAIVVGQFDIAASERNPPVIEVAERQAYDGRLGRRGMKEAYKGYCLPKGSNLCFLMQGNGKETPKFYTFDTSFADDAAGQTTWLSGYMLKPCDGHRCFHSPVYAERASDSGEVDCNVLARSEVDPRILTELDRAQPVHDW